MADSVLINYETVSNPDKLAAILRGFYDEFDAMVLSVNELVVDHSTMVTSHNSNISAASGMGKAISTAASIMSLESYFTNASASGVEASSQYNSSILSGTGPAQLTASVVLAPDINRNTFDTASNPELLRIELEKLYAHMITMRATIAELCTDHELFRSSFLSVGVGISTLGSLHDSFVTEINTDSIITTASGTLSFSAFKSGAFVQAPPATMTDDSVITAMVDKGE